MTVLLHGVAPLPHLGVIRVLGDDAASFLHGQLTQDVSLLPPGQARLAAYCSAKGRMLASFVVLKLAPTELLLVCSRDILAPTLKRLSMFVLRAKAKLSDASAEWQVHGVTGPAAYALAGSPPAPWTAQAVGAAWAVELPPVEGQRRLLWLAASAPAGPTLTAALWDWSEVRAGIATITQPVVEAFVPQMLNYESVGGVNFKKGCYPGQEIVARSQFRGTIKRRAFVVHAEGELVAGMEVFHEGDPEQPVGLVAQAAACPDGGWDAIASLQLSATAEGRLAAGSAGGPSLTLLPLPYLLLADL